MKKTLLIGTITAILVLGSATSLSDSTNFADPVTTPEETVQALLSPITAPSEATYDFYIPTIGVEHIPQPLTEQEVRDRAYAALSQVPGGGSMNIVFNDPILDGRLGRVYVTDNTNTFYVNSAKLAQVGQQHKIESVVIHEAAHILTWRKAMEDGVFLNPDHNTSSWYEPVADCIAIRLGATWTHYTSNCSAYAADVDWILG